MSQACLLAINTLRCYHVLEEHEAAALVSPTHCVVPPLRTASQDGRQIGTTEEAGPDLQCGEH